MKTLSSRTLSVCLILLVAGLFFACGENEKAPAAAPAENKTQPQAPLVKKTELADWCPEHAVPESVCTRCNESLIAGFQKNGDWCKEHGLPESQCVTCHPELKAKFDAMAPKGSK